MAGKEATIFIVDLGASTGDCHNGRVESDLEYGMRYVWDKITGIMLNNKSIGVIGFRTDKTKNVLARDDDSYRNISILKELGPMEMSHLRDLQTKIQPNETDEADAVSAIVVAIKVMEDFTMLKTGKPGKFKRKIVLLTDGEGAIEDADIDPIAQKINESEIELAIV
jgi:ATP-dependent DNA helicase 2 subunit 2